MGDRTVVTLQLVVPTAELADAPRFPTWGKTWGDAEIVSTGPVEQSTGPNGEKQFSQRITLTAFRTGAVALPPVAVVVPMPGGSRTLTTEPSLTLEVASVLPGDPRQAQPEPPAPLRHLPWGQRFWWTLAGFSAAALALGLWVFRRPKTAKSAAPALPPLDELEHELTRIAALVETDAAPARLAAALSGALRRYLGRELVFPALESTTTEIQRHLRSGDVPEGSVRSGVDLLRRLDRVKFSRREAAVTWSEAAFAGEIAAARSLAAGLDRHLRPTPPPVSEAPRPPRVSGRAEAP